MDITIVVTSFERPKLLERCLNSIDMYYPQLPLIIADNSRSPHPDSIELAYNCGASKARNSALKQVETKYVLMLEDDCILTDKTDIQCLIDVAESNCASVVGPRIVERDTNEYRYQGNFNSRHGVIFIEPLELNRVMDVHKVDMTSQIILLNVKDVINAGCWCDKLNVFEHFEFFYRLKQFQMKTVYTTKTEILHYHDPIKVYEPQRNAKLEDAMKYCCDNLGLVFNFGKLFLENKNE